MEGNQSDPADRVDAHDVSLVWTGQSRLDRSGTPSQTICTEYRAKLLSCRHYFLDGGSKNGRGIETIRPELCLLPGSKTIITSLFRFASPSVPSTLIHSSTDRPRPLWGPSLVSRAHVPAKPFRSPSAAPSAVQNENVRMKWRFGSSDKIRTARLQHRRGARGRERDGKRMR